MNKYVVGCLLEHKQSGNKAFLEYSYRTAFGQGSSNEISVLWLDEKGNPDWSSAWHKKSSFNVIDSDIEENLKKIRKYNRKQGGAPISMKPEFAKKIGYTSVHTYASAMACRKNGDIKL